MGLFKIIILFLFLCRVSFAQVVNVELFNKTGYHLYSVYFAKKYVGKIPKDSSIVINNTETLVLQGGTLINTPIAIAVNLNKNQKKNNSIQCATDIQKITNGNFKFDIVIRENETDYRFYYMAHK